MLIYNITFHLEKEVEEHLLIWITEAYIPEVEKTTCFSHVRLCRILSHHQDGQAAYSLQWQMNSSADLHRWHIGQEAKLNEQMKAIFKDKVLSIPTLMEAVE